MAAKAILSPNDPLLTNGEAAAYLKLQPGTLTVWRCTKRRDIPFIRVGRKILYRQSALDAFLLSGECGGAA